MVLDKENETYRHMEKMNESNLIASLDFGSPLPLGNANKEMPAGAPTSTPTQGPAACLVPLPENESSPRPPPFPSAATGAMGRLGSDSCPFP